MSGKTSTAATPGGISPNSSTVLKPSQTETIMTLHNLKSTCTKFQQELDQELPGLDSESEDMVVETLWNVTKIMTRAWAMAKIGHELGYTICDYLRECDFLEKVILYMVDPETPGRVCLAAGRTLEECVSMANRDFIVQRNYLRKILGVAMKFGGMNIGREDDGEENLRISVSLLENLFKHSAEVSRKMIQYGALDHILSTIKATTSNKFYKHTASALANLCIYGDTECYQKMISKKVQDWLFFLATVEDLVTRYYACLAICMLAANKETEKAVVKSGTLNLVDSFLMLIGSLGTNPHVNFLQKDFRLAQGRIKEWLLRVVPMLYAQISEPRSLAAFLFAMEAQIKKDKDKLEIFQDIGAIEALKTVASSPDGSAGPKFARKALEIIGEELPYKLSQNVPSWSVEDVKYWVAKVGFKNYAETFEKQMVDGDLLLLITDEELENDIGIKSGLLRKRFKRELASLKVAADYSSIDQTKLDYFLMSLNPCFSAYTYRMLDVGLDTNLLTTLNDDILRVECKIENKFHRMQLLQAVQDCQQFDDLEVALLSKHIDIFVSYRRSTGSQLASLIKVMLQLRGHKVFIDVDRLSAGKFDTSLFKHIQAAKDFIIILSNGSLDRCLHDDACDDWVHKEICCALEHGKNVIPVLDPLFEWPDENDLPQDMRVITRFNGVRWIHEYQEACVDKLEKFICGEFAKNNRDISRMGSGASSPPTRFSSLPAVPSRGHGLFMDDQKIFKNAASRSIRDIFTRST